MPSTCSVCIWRCSSSERLLTLPSSSPEKSSVQVQTLNKMISPNNNPPFNHNHMLCLLLWQGIIAMLMTYCSACTQSCRPRRLRSQLRWPPTWWSFTPICSSRLVHLWCHVIYYKWFNAVNSFVFVDTCEERRPPKRGTHVNSCQQQYQQVSCT